MAENSQPLAGDNLARLDDRGSPPSEDPTGHLEGHSAHSADRNPYSAEDGNRRSGEGEGPTNNEGENNIETNNAALPYPKPL